jgi:intracellular multiplication protein IcmT
MDINWRVTQKPARFFAVDARAATAIFLWLVHARVWTFIIALITMLVFWIMERRGLTFEAALRTLRVWLIGRRRPALRMGLWRYRVDFGS